MFTPSLTITKRRRSGFTLLELIVVLVVLAVLAAIAVPTFNNVKQNSANQAVNTTLEAIKRNGEAIAVSDITLSDAQIAATAAFETTPRGGMTITPSGESVTVAYTTGSQSATGLVTFESGVGTIDPAGGGGGGGGGGAAPLAYSLTSFDVRQASQTLSPTVTGLTPTSFSYSGTLPDGVVFDSTTGVFTGPSAWGLQGAQISAGHSSSCAVTTTGGAKCWGANYDGQLGDGTTTNSATPVDVSGLTAGVAQISTAQEWQHACAVTTAGAVRCWGSNSHGQLGDGTRNQASTPVAVLNGSGTAPLTGIAKVYVGGRRSCALTTSGAVLCWGENTVGALGDGTTTNRDFPVSVIDDTSTALSGVTALAVGSWHACALLSSGGLKCWGANDLGYLGDGTNNWRATAGDVSGLTSGVAQVSASGSGGCAVTTTGAAKCWGRNDYGQLGDGTTETSFVPVAVSGMSSGVASISLSSYFGCAVTTTGGAKCWGANWDGQLGTGDSTSSLVPVAVVGHTSGVSAISVGSASTCLLTATKVVRCVGWNGSGQLGVAGTNQSSTYVNVTGFSALTGFPTLLEVTATDGSGGTWSQNITLTAS
jgi:prepilin-type N-terminal cleavage/methylation domain-containing protein